MIKLITDYLNTIQNKEYDPEQVTQKYTRNFIDNESEIISNVTQLENVVSKETQLNMLPQTIVDNAQEELDRMEAERIREEKLPLAPTEV